MDLVDKKILTLLMENSRTPYTILSKKARVSRDVIRYRVEKLLEKGIILKFVADIDEEKLGIHGAALFLNIKSFKDSEFREYLRNCSFISWAAELTGNWGYGLSIYGKSNEEIDKNFQILYQKFKDDILNYRFSFHKKNLFYYEKYLNSNPIKFNCKKTHSIDGRDKKILSILAENSRTEDVLIAQQLKISAVAVAKRIRKLESSGYIKSYSLFIDLEKIGLFQYSVFIDLKNRENIQKITSFAAAHPQVAFTAEYLGDPFIELGIFVNNPYNLRKILADFSTHFPDNRFLEVFQFQKEYVSTGPARIAFE